MREVGFFLEDGTLFAVYSEPGKALAYKSPEIDLLLAFDVVLAGVPADSVTIIDRGADLNLLVAPELAKMAATHVDHLRRYLTLKDDLEHDALWRTTLQAQTATVQIDACAAT
ncbi:hypothetical protein CS022_22720 [Veronia nyctiphanis]|uniref:Uncharacterized protein n=1 Tax=Veronia nyctiphanis TaxID=1278244 RepID=A0A4Q0YIR7_9GAMM|nr:hypothetical protein [Veronia nyctiphanis]RXJ70597.1 hypothetical protein CS022_22720 [Veronia nyctiphanis]